MDLPTLHDKVQSFHAEIYEEITRMKERLSMTVTLENAADNALLMREICEFADDLRKELDKLYAMMGNAVVVLATASGTPTLPKGNIARAYFKHKVAARVPSHSKNPEEYREICEALNVPYNPLARLHWPSVTERMTEIFNEKGALPKALEKYQNYNETTLVAVRLGQKATKESEPELPDFLL